MELRLLRDFVVLSRRLNFSKASEELCISQPVLSHHIKTLEENLDVRLLNRNTHSVALTPAGQLFAVEAQKVIAQYDACLKSVRAYACQGATSLRIALQTHAAQSILSSFLPVFAREQPEIKVDCYDSEMDQSIEHLKQGVCDVAFVVRPNNGYTDPGLCHFVAAKDYECVAMNRNHPLSKCGAVSISQFANWGVVCISSKYAATASNAQLHSLERHGVEYRVVGEYPNLESCIFRLIFDERSLLLLPEHRADIITPECVVRPLKEDDCWVAIDAVWDPKTPNPSVAVFLDSLRNFVTEEPPGGCTTSANQKSRALG